MADETTTSTEDVVPGNDAPALNNDQAGRPEQSTEPNQYERRHSQAHLDSVVAQERRKWEAKYADYKELKKKAEKLETLETEQMSEQEKLQKQVQELSEQLEKSTTETLKTLRQNAIIQEAARLNYTDPGDAFVQLMYDDSITIEDGKVTGAAEAVKALAEAKPYLLKQHQAGNLESFNPAGKARNPENDAQRIARLYGQTQGESPIG